MKYVAVTFDDGRSDNLITAFPIMEKNGQKGTVYVTTGFLDGTWQGAQILQSPTKPLTAQQVCKLAEAGWEIGLHGDKHETELADCRVAYEKLSAILGKEAAYGMSVPNSRVEEGVLKQMWEQLHPRKLSYVRRGRRTSTAGLKPKILYGLYTFLRSQWAYNAFNKENLFRPGEDAPVAIPSVVVKNNDSARMILNFISQIPDGSGVVLMLHSILPDDRCRELSNPWVWSEGEFSRLCAGLRQMQKSGAVTVKTVEAMVSAG